MRWAWAAVWLGACGAPEPASSTDTPGDATEAALTATLNVPSTLPAGEPVVLRVDAPGAARSVWQLGGGVSVDVEGLELTHTWEDAGHVQLGVTALARDGRQAQATQPVHVAWPLVDPAVASVTLAQHPSGRWLYLASPDLGLLVADADTGAVLERHHPCPDVRRLSVSPHDGAVAVACGWQEPGVALFSVGDGGALSLTEHLDLTGDGLLPVAVAWAGEGSLLVALRDRAQDVDGLLWRLDASLEVVASQRVGHDLRGLVVQGDAALLTRYRSPDDHGEAWWIDAASLAPTPFSLRHAPGPDSDTNHRGVPTLLGAVGLRPDGRGAVVAGTRANVDRGLVRDGQPLTFENTLRADLRLLDGPSQPSATPGDERILARLDDRDLISAVTFDPSGGWLFAAHRGAAILDIFDAYTLQRADGLLEVGFGVDGLLVSPDGAALWAFAEDGRQLVRWELDGFRPNPTPTRFDLTPPGGDPLDADVLRGKQIFGRADAPMSQHGYVSCYSCHPDGEEDGRVWDFTDRGEGLRRTQTLRGMSDRGDGPMHWSGNFDEVQDFENDVRLHQRGTGFLPDEDWNSDAQHPLGAPKAGLSADLDALDAYVRSLGVRELPGSPDEAAEAQGTTLFSSPEAGCADCHAGGGGDHTWLSPGQPSLHDVGTLTASSGSRLDAPLTGLVAPSLRGAWQRAPFLHDGSAATLRDVVTTHNPADAHGSTSQLTPAEVDALIAHLRSL